MSDGQKKQQDSQQQSQTTKNVVNVNAESGLQQEKSKSKIVALLLCFFLGLLGFHRIYLGKIGSGVIILLNAVLTPIVLAITLGLLAPIAGVVSGVIVLIVIIDFFRIIFGNF